MSFFGLFSPPDINKLKARGDVKSLVKALNYQKYYYVRQAAAEALGQLGNARTVEPLAEALKDSDDRVRRAAAEALGQIGDARAVEPLIVALKDSDSWVKKRAVEALGKISDPRAVEPLIVALKDSDVRDVATRALEMIGLQAIDLLVATLKHEDWHVRAAAAEVLGKIGDVRTVKPLLVALQDSYSSAVRWKAAGALGAIGDVQAVELLIVALKDRDSSVREGAAEALAKISDPRAVEALAVALEDKREQMITFMTEYRINKNYIAEFESAYAATGAFGGMFVRYGCKSYALYRHRGEPQRYIVTHTWSDGITFTRAQERAAQNSYEFQNRSRGWVESVRDLKTAEMAIVQEKPDDQYELLSEA